MGQVISSAEDVNNNSGASSSAITAGSRQTVAYLPLSTIDRLFIKSCLKQFDTYELYCLKKNLLETEAEKDKKPSPEQLQLLPFGELSGSLIHQDKLNEFLQIPKDHQLYNIFYKFLKQLARFPIIAPASLYNGSSHNLDYEYFEFGEIIKLLVLLTRKRANVLGKQYDFNKLVFLTLALAGLSDGVLECYDPGDVEQHIEKSLGKSKKGSPNIPESQDVTKEFNEKTGEAELQYAVYDSKIVWTNLPLVVSFDGLKVDKYFVPSTYLLNFFTLLLLIQSAVTKALQHPELSNILILGERNSTSGNKKKVTDLLKEAAKSEETSFSDVNSKIIHNKIRNLSKEYYNSYKINAFNMIKSIDYRITDVKKLLSKNTVFDFQHFNKFINDTAPYLLTNLNNLFLSFTYLSRTSTEVSNSTDVDNDDGIFKESKLLTYQNMAQMSTFLSLDTSDNSVAQPGSEEQKATHEDINITPICHFNIDNCRNLYIGSKYGFSMKSFEYKVFNWNAPSLLLISGKKIINATAYGATVNRKFHKFDQYYPHLIHKYTDPSANTLNKTAKKEKLLGETVIYGVYLSQPWRKTNKNFFGDDKTLVFQIGPKQNLFKAKSSLLRGGSSISGAVKPGKYAYFNTEGGGIGFGNSQPLIKNNNLSKYQPGNVSLTIDANLEFAVFRHTGIAGLFHHGSIYNENLAESFSQATEAEAPIPTYEDKFLINEIEVWGIGNSEVFKQQLAHWAWEEKEAEKRNRVNLKSLGEERAFLEMAGLVGNNNASGGSV